MPTTLIFGTHPVRESLKRQYGQEGIEVLTEDRFALPSGALPDELVILTSGVPEQDDAQALAFLEELAGAYKAAGERPHRPLVHLLLQKAASLRMLQLSDFPPEVNDAFEVFPFTMEEAWAERMVVRLPGIDQNNTSSGLDRTPIGADSRQFVHLVIIGFDSYAESMAVKAAQVAHFPNYDGKNPQPLRTRISIIQPGIGPARDKFLARFRTLFDNSFYRTVDIAGKASSLHHPQYEGKREDFIDIEWEFVDGEWSHPTVMEKLAFWAQDPRRQLTMVISGQEDIANAECAMALPEAVSAREIPVWVRLRHDTLSASLRQSPRFRHLRVFGMDTEGYNVRLPLMRLARLLHYFYRCSYGATGIPTAFPQEEVEAAWQEAGALKMRLSNVCNVMSMSTKMHSLGHDDQDLKTFYALTAEEVTLLARTEHNRWCVERLLSGTRVCTDEERAAIGRDISLKKEYKKNRDAHYDLCAFDELQADEKGTDVRVYDYDLTACIPLMMESFMKEESR